MVEYIDRDSALEIIQEKQKALCPAGRYGRSYVYGSDREVYDAWEEILDSISAIPVSDVAPVVHGRWIFDSDNEYVSHYHCDKCGEEIDLCNEIYTEQTPNYCPNCGAKMDKEADNAK